jgi:o-succinylbenzoate---CoA ligase
LEYPFQSIRLNKREVRLNDVLDGTILGLDDFEASTIRFIRDWFDGREEFELTTSGSTGAPKKHFIHRRQMEASARATQHALGLRSGEHALICLNTKYIAGQMMLVRSFCTGMRITAVTPSANPLVDYDGDLIDFTAMVPYQVQSILASDDFTLLDNIRILIIGGAAASSDTINALQQYQGAAFATYGMTETISHIALRMLNGPGKSDLYEVLPGIDIEVDDRSCLVIHCPYLPTSVITNDIVQLVGTRHFQWIGRADNIINSGGVKVSPERVEEALEPVIRSLNLHNRFIVSATDDIALGNKIVFVLEAVELAESQKAVLTSTFLSILPRFEAPKSIITLSSFPMTATGKIDRLEIRRLVNDLGSD